MHSYKILFSILLPLFILSGCPTPQTPDLPPETSDLPSQAESLVEEDDPIIETPVAAVPQSAEVIEPGDVKEASPFTMDWASDSAPILVAIRKSDKDTFEALSQHYLTLGSTKRTGKNNILHEAVLTGDISMVKMVKEQKFAASDSMNNILLVTLAIATNQDGDTPLHLAYKNKYWDIASEIEAIDSQPATTKNKEGKIPENYGYNWIAYKKEDRPQHRTWTTCYDFLTRTRPDLQLTRKDTLTYINELGTTWCTPSATGIDEETKKKFCTELTSCVQLFKTAFR